MARRIILYTVLGRERLHVTNASALVLIKPDAIRVVINEARAPRNGV